MSYIPPKEWERLLKRVFAIDPEGKLYVVPDPIRDIIPDADDAYDLGSSTKRWRYLFLSRQLAVDEPLKIKDIDPTPVGDVLLKVLDQVLKLRNPADTADVDLTAKAGTFSGDLLTSGLLKAGTTPVTLTKAAGDVLMDALEKGTLEKLAEVDAATDITTMTITGLDLDASKAFLLLFKVANPTASSAAYRLFFNNDTTETNYYFQALWVTGTTIAAGRWNKPELIFLDAGYEGFATCYVMRPPDGLPRYFASVVRRSGSEVILASNAGSWVTAANVTRIDVSASVVNGIGVGSKLILFGVSK